MAKQVTLWRPDTCSCAITYEWDDTTSEDARTHTPVKTEHTKICLDHQKPQHGIGNDHKKHHDIVLDENRRKNYVVSEIANRHGGRPDEVEYLFDENRVLKVSTKAQRLTQQHKKDLQDWADKNHGAGKVVIS